MAHLLRKARQFLGAPRAEKRAALEWRIKRWTTKPRFRLPSRINRHRLRYFPQLVLARRAARDLYGEPKPLISVLIPTYNRAELLVKRSVPSVLRQTYPHFEIVVVGDACTDDTEARLRAVGDPRIRFHNLPVRGKYPEDPYRRWLVAGSAPGNQAIEMARGKWIAWLDDDDEFSPDHLEVLLRACLESRREFAYGVTMMEVDPGVWEPVGSYPPEYGQICNASVLYGAHLRFFRYDIEAWRLDEPNDWNLWKRMWGAGVRMGFVDREVGKHFLEHRPRETTSPGGAAAPEWEYYPQGWGTSDPRVKGWNLESIAEAQRAKWPEVLRLVNGTGPLPVFMWAPDLSSPSPAADAVLTAYGYVLALAAWKKDRLSLLDWGGGVGHYKLISEALVPHVAIDYHCKDVPLLCKAGRELQPDGTFHEDDESCFARDYDLVMASGSLEYAEDWKQLTRRLAKATRRYLYIARLQVVHRVEAFPVIQRAYKHQYPTEYVSWVLNRQEFLDHVRSLGLSLVREVVMGPGPAIHRAPEPCEFRGFLFARSEGRDAR